MSFTRVVAVLIVVFPLANAFVDTYVYHSKKAKETKDCVVNYAASYYSVRDKLLASYHGNLAETCRSKLVKESWYGLYSTSQQTIMIQIVAQIKSLDTNWFNAVQKCGVDNSCIKLANITWYLKLVVFHSSAINKIYQRQHENLTRIKSYMDNCTHSNN